MPRKTNIRASIMRTNLPFWLGFVAIVSALISITSLLVIGLNLYRMSKEYNSIIETEFENLRYSDSISSDLYRHQTYILRHLTERDPARKAALRSSADALEQQMDDDLSALGENMRGTHNEAAYHNIYSGLVGYFTNAGLIFDFSDSGNIETGRFYLETTLDDYIEAVSVDLKDLGSAIQQDMTAAREKTKLSVRHIRYTAYAAMGLMAIAAVFSLVFCMRISDEIFNKDLLTGVLNFDTFRRLGNKRARSGQLQTFDGLWFSIKDFNFINQHYGSTVGDMILWSFAREIRSHLNKGEMVARNGGDNFLVLAEGSHTEALLNALMSTTAQVTIAGEPKTLPLNSRCGIYHIQPGDDISRIVSSASVALNFARQDVSTDRAVYNDDMNRLLMADKELLHDFERAINAHEFVIYYQPKVDLPTRTVCGAEALVRWIRDGQLIPPDKFIPVLEREGVIPELDFYVLDQVCADIRSWLDQGMDPVPVSTNFSKLHLSNPHFASDVLEIIDRNDIPHQYIETELTESSCYEGMEALQSYVEQMHQSGVKISIDDFGTGYSSLALLKDIKADTIKLDRSFLRSSEEDLDRKLLRSVVRMLLELGRGVICEGVETPEQAEFLLGAECERVQGYLFDRPLPHDEFQNRLINRKYS